MGKRKGGGWGWAGVGGSGGEGGGGGEEARFTAPWITASLTVVVVVFVVVVVVVVGVVVGWLLSVPARCECISGTAVFDDVMMIMMIW